MSTELIKQFTKQQYGLKLKLTLEDNKVVNYLDVKIFANLESLNTTVYVKPTNTPVLISRWFNDSWSYKKISILGVF